MVELVTYRGGMPMHVLLVGRSSDRICCSIEIAMPCSTKSIEKLRQRCVLDLHDPFASIETSKECFHLVFFSL